MEELNALKDKLLQLYQELENENYEVEQEVYDLEEHINEMVARYEYQDDSRYPGGSEELDAARLLKSKMKQMKRQFDFYDQEAELDMMFPDRHDEDFDEDSMSLDSVFGDD